MLLGRVDPGPEDVLHVTGITAALSETARDALFHAVDIAAAADTLVSVDVNHRESLWPSATAVPVYRQLAARADVLFAGQAEGELVSGVGGSPRQLCEALADLGPTEVVVTLGAQGAVAWVDDRFYTQAAEQVTVVDTVGAGDAFVAAYLVERLSGRPVEARLSAAVFAGSIACTNAGDWEGAPLAGQLHSTATDDPVSR